jgi:hypothetical protein
MFGKRLFTFLVLCNISLADVIDDFYSFNVLDIRQSNFQLERYRGKISLVTNVASECGYTDSHYESFVKMQTIFNQRRNLFNILAFPCNQFGHQEPSVSTSPLPDNNASINKSYLNINNQFYCFMIFPSPFLTFKSGQKKNTR